MANSVDDLETSAVDFCTSVPERRDFDARFATALKKIIQNSNLKKKVHVGEQKTSKRRPIPPWQTDRVYDLRVFPGDGHSQDHHRFLRSFQAYLERGDDLVDLNTRCDEVLLSTHEIPSDKILECTIKTWSRKRCPRATTGEKFRGQI